MADLLVLEAVILIGKLVQAGSQEDDFGRKDGELALFALLDLGLGRCSAGISNDADNVTSSEVLMLLLKRRSAFSDLLGLGHDLDPHALSANIIEMKLVSRRSLAVYSCAKTNFLLLHMLSRLEMTKFLDEASDIVVGVEFVRVWVGVLSLAELVDVSGTNLKVLLSQTQHIRPGRNRMYRGYSRWESAPSHRPRHCSS